MPLYYFVGLALQQYPCRFITICIEMSSMSLQIKGNDMDIVTLFREFEK